MSAATEFDVGPLTWVKGEIDLALQRAGEALGEYAASADPTQLKFCRTHVHQVHGALAVVGLEGVTQLTESLESLLLAMEEDRVPAGDAAIATVTRVLEALHGYLDRLLHGEPDQPLRLLPHLQALAAARGITAPHPSDLFFPDLDVRPPRRPGEHQPLEREQLQAVFRAERMRFQKGLLRWLKNPADAEAGREAMRDAVAVVEAQQATPADRAFWWVALALLEALADPALAADPLARQLCSRIDAQMRRSVDGSVSLPERVVRDALYCIAQVPATLHPAIAEVQAAYAVAKLLPDPVPAAIETPRDGALRRLREAIGQADAAWNKFCAGHPPALATFVEQARAGAGLTAEAGHTDLKRLGQGLATIANWLADDSGRFNDKVAIEVATAILLLDSAQESFPHLGTDFAQQVDRMVARLHGLIAGRPPVDEPMPLLDEMTRRAQERLLIGQVGREIRNHLAQVEQTLDGFFRDPAKAAELPLLAGPLKQIAGSLAMLGHFPAVHSLMACGARIEEFSQPDYVPAHDDFEAVANQLSVIGGFVDALQNGERDFEAFNRRMQRVPAGDTERVAPTVEAGLAQQARTTQALAEAWRETPADRQLQDELTQNLHSIQKDADLVANRALGESAKAALAALQAGDADSTALAGIAPLLPEAPLPSAETLKLAEAPHETIDAELLAIFLEEAAEVLATLAAQQALLAANPADVEALTKIRRATHTLKGSGRMVGLAEFGETAWELEQTLNLWLRQDQVPTSELLRMIAEAQQVFSTWVAFLANGEGRVPETEALVALARRLRGIETLPVAVPAPEASVPPAAATPVEAAGNSASEPAPAAPTLYDIFREEARGHLQSLVAEHAALAADPSLPTAFEMTRAAHTLAGISATVGILPLHHLARALELALLRRDSSENPASIEGLETVRQAIVTLEGMFAALARQQAPDEQPQLIDALGDVFPAASVGAEIIPLRPEISPPPEAEAPPAPEALPENFPLTDEFDDQLLPLFLEEAGDLLRDLSGCLHAWRADSAGDSAPQAIARLLHTFKGSARMAGAMNLGELTHQLEARVQEALRGGPATPAFIEAVENGCDALAQAVERLRAAPPPATGASALPPESVATGPFSPEAESEAGSQRATLRVRADLIDRLVNDAGELSIARARIEGEMRGLKGSLRDLTDNVIRLRSQLREIEIQAETQIQTRTAQSDPGHADFDPLELDRFTRFQELTRFMAESVNDVATVQQNLLRNLDDANAAILAQARLNRSLQQELMGARMVPFASQAERLYRIVRQAAKDTGKRASLDIVGGKVEIDRSVLDKMLAPIEHMLRNAVTHGIEGRSMRIAAGKPEVGEIVLKLAQEDNELILTLHDDGRGLDAASLRARGEAMGLLSPGQPADERALFDLIFQPGFSTASEVTQVSGRGVGMDVVRTEVAALGGRIETDSQSGAGTTFRLYLPLTLALTQTLLVRVGSQAYALPATMIEQVLELKEKALAAMRAQGEAEWQGNRYPLHFLPQLLGDAGAVPEAHRRYRVLLLRAGAQRVAVLVDELLGNQEVVVKNMGPQLARVVGLAGATVLADGRVVLILNPVALAGRVPAAGIAAPAAGSVPSAHLPTVLVVDDSLTVRKITGRLLAREGYRVLLAKDGIDALEQLVDERPDVVLSDIEMPRMDGFDFIRNLRADENLRDLPVIVITSRTADKHRNYAFEIGANHYLGKPYDEEELLALVAGYCRQGAG